MSEVLEAWITVYQINGDKKYFNFVRNFNAIELKELLDDKNPNETIEIINGTEIIKNNFVFDQNICHTLTMLKTRSLYSYHQDLYDILYSKTIEVTESENYYCYCVEYYHNMLTLKIKSFHQGDDIDDINIVYHREFYYRQGYRYLNFDRYDGEFGIIIDKFEEFGESFDDETRDFMDELIKKCKFEEEKRGYHIRILFDMPESKDKIIDNMHIYVCNNFVDYSYDSDYGDSDDDFRFD